jgi:nicotinate-nucleotide pyrophosphorylase (carboxylating)
MNDTLFADLQDNVARALREDVGDGDLTSRLIPASVSNRAEITARKRMVLAGRPWADEVFHQVSQAIQVNWHVSDGETVKPNSTLCSISGPARALLTAERTVLNFLQLLSATATLTADYCDAIHGLPCRILDTRKTIPGLRLAQKYAVRCGGGYNHRIGLFDAILIKENHILSAGGIAAALAGARALHPHVPLEIEVESLDELRAALAARAERLLLDNFSVSQLQDAVAINRAEGDPPAELEASGGVTLDTISAIAATGVDYISVGALTKNIEAVDLSMRFV